MSTRVSQPPANVNPCHEPAETVISHSAWPVWRRVGDPFYSARAQSAASAPTSADTRMIATKQALRHDCSGLSINTFLPSSASVVPMFRPPTIRPSLRPVVVVRKVVQGTHSDNGLQNHSVLQGLLETERWQRRKWFFPCGISN